VKIGASILLVTFNGSTRRHWSSQESHDGYLLCKWEQPPLFSNGVLSYRFRVKQPYRSRLLDRRFGHCTVSSVGRKSDTLPAGGSGERIPVSERFPATVQTGPPSLLHDGYRLSFPEEKRPSRDVDHQPSSNAEVKERVQL